MEPDVGHNISYNTYSIKGKIVVWVTNFYIEQSSYLGCQYTTLKELTAVNSFSWYDFKSSYLLRPLDEDFET